MRSKIVRCLAPYRGERAARRVRDVRGCEPLWVGCGTFRDVEAGRLPMTGGIASQREQRKQS
jgi:hypothetical protein